MKQRGKLVVIALVLLIFPIAAAIFYPGPDPENMGNEMRSPATNQVRLVGIEDLPSPIENEGRGRFIWAIRRQAVDFLFDATFVAAVQFMEDAPGIIERHGRGESNFGNMVLAQLGIKTNSLSAMLPILAQDGVNSPRLFVANPYRDGEIPDYAGRPLRWNLPENLVAGYTPYKPAPILRVEPEAKVEPARPKIVKYPHGASHYREMVENFSRRYNLNTDLVMAIIHSESDFRPGLVSPKSAMGLMQLLPSTASDEVHRFLYGRRGQVSYDQLSVPEINIRYGTAYLHILFNRYFRGVQDERVRESCAVASYNLGPNRFLKLYGPTNALAVQRINSMSPEEFYEDLFNRLPTKETRYYVEKVRRMKAHYAPR